MLGHPFVISKIRDRVILDWMRDYSHDWNQGTVDGNQPIRNSMVSWMNPSNQIKRELLDYASEANKKGNWKYDIVDVESLQNTIYDVGQYYDWHIDYNDNHPEGKIRKLSFTMILSDGFKGGKLQIETGGPREKSRILDVPTELGTIVWFPSLTWHRVTKVTSGVRKSLVCWFLGNHG